MCLLLLLLRQMLMAVQWCHWISDRAGLARKKGREEEKEEEGG